LISSGPRQRRPSEYDDEEKLTHAKEFKDSGAALFAEKKYADAITAYSKACELIEAHPDSTSSPIWYALYLRLLFVYYLY